MSNLVLTLMLLSVLGVGPAVTYFAVSSIITPPDISTFKGNIPILPPPGTPTTCQVSEELDESIQELLKYAHKHERGK